MVEHALDDETRYRLLRLLEQDPALSQRSLARELGVSVGKVNYCLRALLDKGLVKVGNFHNSRNKRAYLYMLTPRGLSEKSRITRAFLARKLAEYEDLEQQIEALRREVAADHPG
ncbi:MAG TPA: MarR family EPS-associated transcriptional regulator [Gammaproteobacteria bacterium]|nr:MarR family EPS-associated transcriptional regulator [Gammaproteobacteria bacterium]